MRWEKIILVGVILFAFASTASAIDENEIRAALQNHICPTQKIDTRGLPDLKPCDRFGGDLIAANKCQDHELSVYYKILDYNKLYDACHADYSGKTDTQRRKSEDADAVNRAERAKIEDIAREGEARRATPVQRSQGSQERTVQRSPASQDADSGWQCFADYSSCTSFCRQELGATGNAGWCGGICSSSGTGRMPKPAHYGDQRCYHAP
jgi:hypothetical protein